MFSIGMKLDMFVSNYLQAVSVSLISVHRAHVHMEIPENVKVNILAVLLSNGRDKGTKLDAFCQTFQTVMKEQLHYQALGYHYLMDFFQAMPDVVR